MLYNFLKLWITKWFTK